MAAEAFQCTIVTPEQAMFDAPVVYANLPAHDGQLGVMHDRAPMLIQLGAGRLELHLAGGKYKRFDLEGGFAQMNRNRLTLVSEKASDPDAGREVDSL